MKLNYTFLKNMLIWIGSLYLFYKAIIYFTGYDQQFVIKIIAIFALLAFIIKIYSRRGEEISTSVKQVLLWLFIFSVLIISYAFRFELDVFKNRVLGVLIPSYSWTNNLGELVLARNKDGHFYVQATTKNNQKIDFLIDTGATDIALTLQDAKKLGFNISALKYTKKYNTANGIAYAAPVRIDQLTIGKKTFYNLEASVSNDGLDTSLLGMSLIGNFSHFKITNDLLILKY